MALQRELTLVIGAKNRADKDLKNLGRLNERVAKQITDAYRKASTGIRRHWDRTFDGIKRGFQRTAAEARRAGRVISSAYTRVVNIQTAIAAAGVGLFAREVFNLGKQAAVFQDVARGYRTMVGNMGVDSNRLLAQMKRMTRGTVDELTLMQQANTAILLGIPIDRFDKLLAIARNAAIQTGQSMDFMLQSIVTGIGRQSKLILDNLGIIVGVEQANERYAATLGKVSSALTDAEKKQAFLNAVIEAGEEQIRLTGGAAESSTEAFQGFNAALNDFAITAGERVLPVLESILNSLTGIIRGSEEANEIARRSVPVGIPGMFGFGVEMVDPFAQRPAQGTADIMRQARQGLRRSTRMPTRAPRNLIGGPTLGMNVGGLPGVAPLGAGIPADIAGITAGLAGNIPMQGTIPSAGALGPFGITEAIGGGLSVPRIVVGQMVAGQLTARGDRTGVPLGLPALSDSMAQAFRSGIQQAGHERDVQLGRARTEESVRQTNRRIEEAAQGFERQHMAQKKLTEANQQSEMAARQAATTIISSWNEVAASTQTMADDVVGAFAQLAFQIADMLKLMQSAQAGSLLSFLGPIGIGLAAVSTVTSLSSRSSANRREYSHAAR